MPLRQYFTWVGSLLLAGLFAADWLFPVPVHALRYEIPPNQTVNLRIRSDQKWPEKVVFDTTPSLRSVAGASPESEVVSNQRFALAGQPRDAFAAMLTARSVIDGIDTHYRPDLFDR
jgi:hypothetical protein